MFKKLNLVIITLSICFSVSALAQNTMQDESSQKLYEEYVSLNQKLQTIQQQAFADEEISKKATDFSEKIEAEMIKKDASVKEKLDKRENIIDKYEKAELNGNEEELASLQQEYMDVEQELKAHQAEAMQVEAIAEEGRELQDALLTKMQEIDPDVPQIIARLEQIGNELQQKQQ